MEAQVLKALGKLKKLVPRGQKELKDVIDAATAAMTAAQERKTKGQSDGSAVSGGRRRLDRGAVRAVSAGGAHAPSQARGRRARLHREVSRVRVSARQRVHSREHPQAARAEVRQERTRRQQWRQQQ
ncbi:hypothetical protein PINS_up006737 [Pythium insidiosum]|nr:hypothetical protein PINS_up006737 [Pythium insidiosum]